MTISRSDNEEGKTPIHLPVGRRRRHRSVASLFGLVVVAAIGSPSSSAFVSPRSLIPSALVEHISSPCRNTRSKRKIQSTSSSLLVSLEPLEAASEASTHEHNGSIRPPDQNITLSDVPKIELVNSRDKADANYTERIRIEEDVDVKELDDLPTVLSPSVPVSFDGNGLVQAEAVASPSAEIALIGTSVANTTTLSVETEPEYPQFIQFLFTKDSNGQTLASKLVNFVLLAVSFGYVFSSIFYIDKGMTRGWSPGEITMRIPLDTWASYENSLSEKPVTTKTIINIVIYLLGDWLSQTLFTGKNVLDFDAGRTLKNGFVGMCFGPAVHEYYEFSDFILPVEGMTMGVTNRVFKILMDQTFYLSIKCSIYIMAIGILNGESVESSSENVKNRIKPIMFTAWKFWPLVHCVTYGLIPARHRILWVNSVDLVWNAILASKARNDDVDDNEGGEEGEGNLNKVEPASAGEPVNGGSSSSQMKATAMNGVGRE